jgi:hypothetical protein
VHRTQHQQRQQQPQPKKKKHKKKHGTEGVLGSIHFYCTYITVLRTTPGARSFACS